MSVEADLLLVKQKVEQIEAQLSSKITYNQLSTLAGNGLAGSGATTLDVNVDNSTLEINLDTLRVKDGGITSAKILDGTIVAGDIANDTLTATQIAVDAIGSSELADNAVDTAAIAALAITTAKITDANVTNAKLANGAVTTLKTDISFATTAARDLAITAPVNGMLCYVTGTGLYYTYVTSAWISSAGQVLQTVSTFKNDIYTHTTTTTATDIPGMSVAITPRSTTNKVLITIALITSNSGVNHNVSNLYRGATLIAQPATSGAPNGGTLAMPIISNLSMVTGTLTFLDSPATTSATTYKLNIMTNSGTAYVNRRGDSAAYTGVSSITAQEISA